MELKDRLALIIKETMVSQREFATILGVTESYISTLLSGRRSNQTLSHAMSCLIEEKFGYSADWVRTGSGPRLKPIQDSPDLPYIHTLAVRQLQTMSDDEVVAVLAFMDALSKKKFSLKSPEVE